MKLMWQRGPKQLSWVAIVVYISIKRGETWGCVGYWLALFGNVLNVFGMMNWGWGWGFQCAMHHLPNQKPMMCAILTYE